MSDTSEDVSVNQIPSLTPVGTDVPWDNRVDVLSMRSFPGSSTMRWNSFTNGEKRTESCSLCQKRHRSLFTVNKQFTSPGLLGKKECPSISVCFNAENIWEAKLPRGLTGLKNRVEFSHLPDVRTALRVLRKGTYWFPQLLKRKKFKESAFQRNMARLLAGFQTPEGPEPFGLVKSRPLNKAAVQRFRSMLATVDGLVMQVLLAFPGSDDFQSWSRIDQITRCLIANIIPDYFKDLDPDRALTYTKVKDLRKKIKMEGFNPSSSLAAVRVPRELSALRVALSLVRGETPLSYLQVMMLSQTRASGVPPRSVYDRTLAKTKEILITPCDIELYKLVRPVLAKSVDQFYAELLLRIGGSENRERFFQRVVEEGKISLSDSGEFFTKTDSGGKLESARKMLSANPEIPEVDLHTGELTGKILSKDDRIGDRLFHWSLNQWRDRTQVYEKNCMSCRISLVAELGKYRTITVSTLQHAMLLHPFSHMGLKIIEALPSSESGVGAGNHAWNFFKRLSHKNPSASFIFNEKIQTSVFSTDWSSATDYCDTNIAGAMINRLMSLLGVPAWYRETVLFALTGPRQVEFLDRNGAPVSVFYTKRGVLMGDPVTKTVLHLHHIVGARIAGNLLLDVFKDGVLDDSSSDEET